MRFSVSVSKYSYWSNHSHWLLHCLEGLFATSPPDFHLHVFSHPGAYADNQGRSILTRKKYLCALIIKREADDSIWHLGMNFKQLQIGIDRKARRIIKAPSTVRWKISSTQIGAFKRKWNKMGARAVFLCLCHCGHRNLCSSSVLCFLTYTETTAGRSTDWLSIKAVSVCMTNQDICIQHKQLENK